MELKAIHTCLIGYMLTSHQYKLFGPARSKIIISTTPKIVENKRVEFIWPELGGGVVLSENGGPIMSLRLRCFERRV